MAYSSENFYKTFKLVRKRIPYKICIKAINPEEILLRSNIKALDETALFIEAYEAVTHSRFKMVPNQSAQSSPVCRRRWTCNHSAVSGMDKKCPASINILILKISNQNRLKDAFLRRDPPHPAVIKINPNHNHALFTPFTRYKLLKVNNGVKECFYEYFKRGYYGARAKCFHEQCLRKANFYALGDESMNPSLQAIFKLYTNWLKMKDSQQVDTVKIEDNTSPGSLQAANIQENQQAEIRQSSQNFINVEDILSKLKKEPDEFSTNKMNITNEAIEVVKPVANIKQEILNDDENNGLPIISSYGSLALPLPELQSQSIFTAPAKSPAAKLTMQSIFSVMKVLQPAYSQVVVYDQPSNTYKVVKCLAVNTSDYSAPGQFKSQLPSTLLPSRISLYRL